MRTIVAVVVGVGLAWALPCGASPKTLAECAEGGDFIANAARSRDNGIAPEAFLERLEQDLLAIRAFPPALRWFARDEDDERMLVRAAREVFDQPRAPEQHAHAFLSTCIGGTSA